MVLTSPLSKIESTLIEIVDTKKYHLSKLYRALTLYTPMDVSYDTSNTLNVEIP